MFGSACNTIMKYLLITLCLAVSAYGNLYSHDDAEVYGINSQYLKSYLRQRQEMNNITANVEQVCPGKGEEFEEALMKLKECVDGVSENQETACSMIRNHYMRCSRPMIKVFEDCFPEEAKDVPKMVFESIKSVSNYLCKSDGEHILELMNNCVMKPNYRLSRCERKLRVKAQQFTNRVPSKSEICEFMQSFKYCIQGHINYACGNQITKEATFGLYDAVMAPCNDLNEIQESREVELF